MFDFCSIEFFSIKIENLKKIGWKKEIGFDTNQTNQKIEFANKLELKK